MTKLKETAKKFFKDKYVHEAHDRELNHYRENNYQIGAHILIGYDEHPYKEGFADGYKYALTDFLNRLKEVLDEK